MKRYIRNAQTHTETYNPRLANRFIAYCKNAGCPRADILYIPTYDLHQINGVPVPRLRQLIAQFKSALAAQGQHIIFETADDVRIIRLETDTSRGAE